MAGSYRHYQRFVDEWAKTALAGLDRPRAVSASARALGALWKRSRGPLGPRMLGVVAERIVQTLSRQYPWVEKVRLDQPRSLGRIGRQSSALAQSEAVEGLKRILVEFLVIAGELSGERFAAELEDELRKRAGQG